MRCFDRHLEGIPFENLKEIDRIVKGILFKNLRGLPLALTGISQAFPLNIWRKLIELWRGFPLKSFGFDKQLEGNPFEHLKEIYGIVKGKSYDI